jgi:membrane protease YdiL (CAAX protease family)
MSPDDETPNPADIPFVPDIPSRVPTDFNPYQPPGDASLPGESAEIVAELATPPMEPARPHPGLGMAIVWTIAVAAAQLVVTLVVLVFYIALLVATGTPPGELESSLGDLSGALLIIATLTTLAVAWTIARLMLGRDCLRLVGWRGFAPLQLLWVVLLVLPLQAIAGEASAWAAEVLPSFNGEMFMDMSQLPLVLIVVGGCLLPAVGEELLFRGFFSRGLMGNYGLGLGALLATLLFALMHLDPVQVCGTFVLGLGFQYVFVTSRSLLLSMTSHFLNNLFAFVMMRLSRQDAAADLSASDHMPPLIVLASFAVLPPLLGLLYQSRTFWRLPDGVYWSPLRVSCEAPPPSLGARAETHRPSLLLVLVMVIAYALFVLAIVNSGSLTN